MAAFVMKDAFLWVNGVDLSDHVRSLTLNAPSDLVEATAMGDTDRIRLAGISEWSVDVTFKQDFDSASVDATLFSLRGADPFAIRVKPTSAVAGTSNPMFYGNVMLGDYPILAGAIGDLAESAVTFPSSGALSRAVAEDSAGAPQ